MNSRREVRQLAPGDQFEVSLTLQLELIAATQQEDGGVVLHSKVVPCGTSCGATCGCGSQVLKECAGPFDFVLKGSQRVPYHGNLQQLLADSERIKQQIARLAGADQGATTGTQNLGKSSTTNGKE